MDSYDILDIDEGRISALIRFTEKYGKATCMPSVLIEFAEKLEDFTSREKAYVLSKLFNHGCEMCNRIDAAMDELSGGCVCDPETSADGADVQDGGFCDE